MIVATIKEPGHIDEFADAIRSATSARWTFVLYAIDHLEHTAQELLRRPGTSVAITRRRIRAAATIDGERSRFSFVVLDRIYVPAHRRPDTMVTARPWYTSANPITCIDDDHLIGYLNAFDRLFATRSAERVIGELENLSALTARFLEANTVGLSADERDDYLEGLRAEHDFVLRRASLSFSELGIPTVRMRSDGPSAPLTIESVEIGDVCP